MAKTARIQARVDAELKEKAQSIFESLGMSLSEGVNLYLAQVVNSNGVPFPVKIPNKETIEAMQECLDGKGELFESKEELFKAWREY